MTKEYWIIYLSIFYIDFINIWRLRDLLYSFLHSKRNVKSAKKIHAQQKRFDRLTLHYIINHTKYPRNFSFFWKIWVIYIFLLLPQWFFIVLVHLFNLFNPLVLVIILVILKLVFLLIIGMQFKFGSLSISRFDKRY